MHREAAALFAAVGFRLLAGGPAHAVAPAACQAVRAATHPDCRQAAACLNEWGRSGSQIEEAIRQIQQWLAHSADCPWLLFYLGRMKPPDDPSVEAVERQAAAGFAAQREPKGELMAREYLRYLLGRQGRSAEALLEGNRAIQLVRTASDPILRAQGELLAGRQLFESARDLSVAKQHLLAALGILDETAGLPGADGLRSELLVVLGNVSSELGLFREAQAAYESYLHLAQVHRDLSAEAGALYGLARIAFEQLTELPVPEQKAEVVLLAEKAAAAAEKARHPASAVEAHWVLAGLLRGRAARDHLAACQRGAVAATQRALCLTGLAYELAASDPAAARKAVDQAIELTDGDPWERARAQGAAMRVAWAAGPRAKAVSTALAGLGAVEDLGAAQGGQAGRAGLLSTWSDDYYWLAGQLLGAWWSDRDPLLLERAFAVGEHLRGRALLATLERAQAAPLSPERLLERRLAFDASIRRVKLRQLDPQLPQSEREHAGEDAAALELERGGLKSLPLAMPERFATLSQVRRSLARNEALLSFQIAPWQDWRGDPGGGAWLLVATRHAPPRAYRLQAMGRVELRHQVDAFAALIQETKAGGRDAARQEARAAAELYREILAAALAELPPTIDHLIVVPDDELNLAPLGALRREAGEPPLACRYRITLAPSATLWLRWRGQKTVPARWPALALADPAPPDASAASRLGSDAGVLRQRLPFARREAAAVERWLGGEKRVGDAVSVELVKQSSPPLAAFGILHFATHTLIHDHDPESSGIWLSPRRPGAGEDGLLRMNDIVSLRLEGRAIVLSSCSSASGRLLRGEGVLSLARAFFAAGSTAVVGSLWPQWDDDAAALFDRFYFHLAQGRSLGMALTDAQRDRFEAGAPTAAWAGIVLLGNGDLVPLPGGRSSFVLHRGAVLLAAVALALLLALPVLRSGRRRAIAAAVAARRRRSHRSRSPGS
jgi:CHAT domain-containing protein